MDETDNDTNPFGELSQLEPDADAAQKAISRVRANLSRQSEMKRRFPWFWRAVATSAACFMAAFVWLMWTTVTTINTPRPHTPPTDATLLDRELKAITGIENLKFGATQVETVDALGKPDSVDPVEHELNYFSRGFSIVLNEHGLARVDCYTKEARSTAVRDFQGNTSQGIRMGASREQIEKLYGASEPRNNNTNVLAFPSRGLEFTLKDDRLIRIVLKNVLPP